MGVGKSKEFHNTHILYYTIYHENKLYVYVPEQHRFLCFTVTKPNSRFRFHGEDSISTSKGSIYFIGGLASAEQNDSETAKHPRDLIVTDQVFKINLNKHIDGEIKLVERSSQKNLPEPRTGHLLVYSEPYIFALAGYEDRNIPARTFLKYHRKKKEWSKMAEFTYQSNLVEPTAIAMNKEVIYLFDTSIRAVLPRIFKYMIDMDSWTELILQIKNRDIAIPNSVSCSIYQISDKDLLILGGASAMKSPLPDKAFFYTFDTITQQISPISYNSSLDYFKKDLQGTQDYSDSQNVYCKLGERKVRIYKKATNTWTVQDLKVEDRFASLGWCTKR